MSSGSTTPYILLSVHIAITKPIVSVGLTLNLQLVFDVELRISSHQIFVSVYCEWSSEFYFLKFLLIVSSIDTAVMLKWPQPKNSVHFQTLSKRLKCILESKVYNVLHQIWYQEIFNSIIYFGVKKTKPSTGNGQITFTE